MWETYPAPQVMEVFSYVMAEEQIDRSFALLPHASDADDLKHKIETAFDVLTEPGVSPDGESMAAVDDDEAMYRDALDFYEMAKGFQQGLG